MAIWRAFNLYGIMPRGNDIMRKFGFIALLAVFMLPVAALAQDRILLWEKGVPGFENRANKEEFAKDYYVKQINNPSLTIYRPVTGTANGAAVIILPGGGHEKLVINSEGRDAAQFMARQGVTAFVLRYRLFREEGSPYTINDARADTERAIRLIRFRADEYGLNPKRIGIMAFSAGGELARMALLSPPVEPLGDGGEIDETKARPDFGILVYPGPIKGEREDIGHDSPPLFLVATNDDECCSWPIIELAMQYNKASASAEVHLYAKGGHAFNMGQRTKNKGLANWTERLKEWMAETGLLTAKPTPAAGD